MLKYAAVASFRVDRAIATLDFKVQHAYGFPIAAAVPRIAVATKVKILQTRPLPSHSSPGAVAEELRRRCQQIKHYINIYADL